MEEYDNKSNSENRKDCHEWLPPDESDDDPENPHNYVYVLFYHVAEAVGCRLLTELSEIVIGIAVSVLAKMGINKSLSLCIQSATPHELT